MGEIIFNQVVSKGCGLDVHKETVVATIDGEGLRKTTKEFCTFTSSLTELRDWLLEIRKTVPGYVNYCWQAYLSQVTFPPKSNASFET